VTWVRIAPTVPVVTLTRLVVVPFTTVTKWDVPTVCTDDVGTVVTPTALPVTMAIPASPPEKSPRLDDSMATVTG